MDKEKLKGLFQDNKKLKTDIMIVLTLGVLLIILGNSFFGGNKQNQDNSIVIESDENTISSETQNKEQRDLERRLEAIFSKVEGAGEIKVMVTMANGNELVVAEETKNENSTTTESGQQGDKRTIENVSSENKIVLLDNKDGSSAPLILKELEPKVEGIVIVAQGGDDIIVKEALSRAAQALLNVPAHKVEILKMK